jgi:hypothetical protein
LPPGVYSLIGVGESGFLAFALTVLPPAKSSQRAANAVTVGLLQDQSPSVQPVLDVVAYTPPFETLRDIIMRYYPEMELPVVNEQAYRQQLGETPEPASYARSAGIQDAVGAEGRLRDLLEAMQPATSIKAHKITILPNGILRGRLMGVDPITGRPVRLRDQNVFLIRDNQVIARSVIDADGVFQMQDVQPGVYSWVACGRAGLAALGVNLVTAQQQAKVDHELPWFTALQENNEATMFVNVITDPRDIQQGLCGGCGGGGLLQPPPTPPQGGGGGGGGGGGTDGLIFGLLGGALGAAGLANDRDQGSPPGP